MLFAITQFDLHRVVVVRQDILDSRVELVINVGVMLCGVVENRGQISTKNLEFGSQAGSNTFRNREACERLSIRADKLRPCFFRIASSNFVQQSHLLDCSDCAALDVHILAMRVQGLAFLEYGNVCAGSGKEPRQCWPGDACSADQYAHS
jgi:hypothetical protein